MSLLPGGPVAARWLVPPLALLLAGCTAGEVPRPSAAEDAASPFADCAALTVPPAAAVPVPSAPSASASAALSAPASAADASGPATAGSATGPSGPAGDHAAELPDLTLSCFTGGAPVRLTALRGPAVINLWGSWCDPCRAELPLMQELAAATAGRLRVIGVDTRDSRDAGASFAADRGVSFPTLFDPELKLLTALGRINLPVTVFVAADGGRHVYAGKALDKPTLGGLVRNHTGVTVTG